jgi:hypothetical protein
LFLFVFIYQALLEENDGSSELSATGAGSCMVPRLTPFDQFCLLILADASLSSSFLNQTFLEEIDEMFWAVWGADKGSIILRRFVK